MKKILFIAHKKTVRIFCLIVGLVLFVYMGLSASKYLLYREYFSILTRVSRNPGLNDGYIPQGITFYNGFYYTVGYMNDGTASRIYKISQESKKPVFVTLVSNGKAFTGHTGGLQYSNDSFYLANESDGLYKINASLLENAINGEKIEIGNPLKVNNRTSFVFTDENFLYTGEFNYKNYQCTNKFTFNDITHNAIVEKFNKNDLSKPIAIYSIPNKVQGFCITDKGTIVLSTGYGLKSSLLYVYKEDDIIETDFFMHGAPVFFLEKPTRTIVAPPMTEDLDIVNGKVVTLFESASNKYIFGKAFGADYIAGLKIE